MNSPATTAPASRSSEGRSSAQLIRAEAPVLAHNYHPLPVVARAEGTWVEDVEGRRYLDMLAGYSALNFGHRHPALVEAAHRQLDEVTLTSRAFLNDRLAGFAERLAELTGLDMVLPMNTGAEAVESAQSSGIQHGAGVVMGGVRITLGKADHGELVVGVAPGPVLVAGDAAGPDGFRFGAGVAQ